MLPFTDDFHFFTSSISVYIAELDQGIFLCFINIIYPFFVLRQSTFHSFSFALLFLRIEEGREHLDLFSVISHVKSHTACHLHHALFKRMAMY